MEDRQRLVRVRLLTDYPTLVMRPSPDVTGKDRFVLAEAFHDQCTCAVPSGKRQVISPSLRTFVYPQPMNTSSTVDSIDLP